MAVPRRAGTVVRLPGAAGGRCRRRCVWPGLVRGVDDRGSASGRGTHGVTCSCSGVCRRRFIVQSSSPHSEASDSHSAWLSSRGPDHQRTAIKMTSRGNLIPANAALCGSTGRTKCRRFPPTALPASGPGRHPVAIERGRAQCNSVLLSTRRRHHSGSADASRSSWNWSISGCDTVD